ncbi:uncharacterized protein BXZ73DRAFT_103230 [Epithele typhae]|uniref:uncharacterized protein n=1 Tax=Epithele typhae TaxID=378194 RepID=UPI002008E492|nr:uncharacterized protein BXZ73DRAFT_103230 [Epithele typhae]KAH9925344.1 hypothetical protein BXZ73DRAFT_103230 [Epithele typhae]
MTSTRPMRQTAEEARVIMNKTLTEEGMGDADWEQLHMGTPSERRSSKRSTPDVNPEAAGMGDGSSEVSERPTKKAKREKKKKGNDEALWPSTTPGIPVWDSHALEQDGTYKFVPGDVHSRQFKAHSKRGFDRANKLLANLNRFVTDWEAECRDEEEQGSEAEPQDTNEKGKGRA